MLKYTSNTIKKLQQLLKDAGYKVRTGKGSFNTGYCILESKKVVVLNRYHSLEAQINALVELINRLDIDVEQLPEASAKWHAKVSFDETGIPNQKPEES